MTYYIGNGWSPERRKKQAELIKQQKPWEHTTGPKTKAGKDIAKQNALKHGLRSKEGEELRHMMAVQSRFVTALLAELKKDGYS